MQTKNTASHDRIQFFRMLMMAVSIATTRPERFPLLQPNTSTTVEDVFCVSLSVIKRDGMNKAEIKDMETILYNMHTQL